MNRWLINPLADTLLISGVWIFPFVLLIGLHEPKAVWLYLAFTIFLRLPHFFATLPVTYLNKENYPAIRQHPVALGIIPIAIMVIYSLHNFFPKDIRAGLFLFSLLFGMSHAVGQGRGFLRIYQIRLGLSSLQKLKIIETCIFALLFTVASAKVASYSYPGVKTFVDSWIVSPNQLIYGILAATALWVFTFLKMTQKKGISKNESAPLLIFFLSFVATHIYWPFYDAIPGGAWLYFYIYDSQHSLSYLVFTQWIGVTESKPSYYLRRWLVYSAVSAAAISPFFFIPDLFSQNIDKALSVALIPGLSAFIVLHYYLETIIWKKKYKMNPSGLEKIISNQNHESQKTQVA